MRTQQRIFIAENFLRILNADTNHTVAVETYYVLIAARHGVTNERISELTGIPLNRVAIIVSG